MSAYAQIRRRSLMRTALNGGGVAGGDLPARIVISGKDIFVNGSKFMPKGMSEGTWGKMKILTDPGLMVTWGANHCRILIRGMGKYGGIQPPSLGSVDSYRESAGAAGGYFLPENFAQFASEVQALVDAGIWVAIAYDTNCGQNGNQDSDMVTYCTFDGGGGARTGVNFFMTGDADTARAQASVYIKERFKAGWRFLAAYFKNVPRIIWYEVMPEPMGNDLGIYGDAGWDAVLTAFYVELMDEIDTVDGRTPFCIGPRIAYKVDNIDEAYLPAGTYPRFVNRVVYTGNIFFRVNGTEAQNKADWDSRLQSALDMRTARNVPVYINQCGVRYGNDIREGGARQNVYLKYYTASLVANHMPHAVWQIRQNTVDPDEYANIIETGGVDDLSGARFTEMTNEFIACWAAITPL